MALQREGTEANQNANGQRVAAMDIPEITPLCCPSAVLDWIQESAPPAQPPSRLEQLLRRALSVHQ
ncbi:hypothetical protein TRIUR3_32315 [Triticum urartu]|uniref:Uncharacterized protein n=1 Tax=Triticum urartu TaxID=4572 RepID=M7ZQA7_TRIUA|nr:hypothetical protein TRIUR3_32315 [Triticum urartu]